MIAMTTHKIPRSALAPSLQDAEYLFGQLVDIFIRDLQAWRAHDAKVRSQAPLRPAPKPEEYTAEEDPATAFWKATAAWQAEKLARYEPYPPPIAHPHVLAAVKPVFGADGKIAHVPNFEVVNDDPTPERFQ
jgi:hypothetical protein